MNQQQALRLIRLARLAITSRFKGVSQLMQKAELDAKKIKELNEHKGVFVTLLEWPSQQLRGCVGFIYTALPLFMSVQEAAKSAAFNDPRFMALTEKEIDKVIVEISVLSNIKLIEDKSNVMKKIKIGKHGLIVEKGFNSGLLLPQVATEYGWDAKTFVEQTCIKAGLRKDAWKNHETKIYTFEAEVFREKRPNDGVEKSLK